MTPRVLLSMLSAAALSAACGPPEDREPKPKTGDIVTVAGTGEQATDPVAVNADGLPAGISVEHACFDSPVDIAFSPTGELHIIDWNGHKIRVLRSDGLVYPVVGAGVEGDACHHGFDHGSCPGLEAQLNHPADITFDQHGKLWISAWHNSKIKTLDLSSGQLTNVCGSGARDYKGDGGPCFDAQGLELVAFDLPSSVAFDRFGNLFIADQANQVIRRLGPDASVKTVCGSCPKGGFGCPAGIGYSGDGGPATLAKLNNSYGQAVLPAGKIAFDAAGNLYIADTFNHVVRRVVPGSDGILGAGEPSEEIIETIVGTGSPGFAGDGGPARAAELHLPTDIAVAADGTLFIADRGNHCVRRVDTSGVISTVAGQCGTPGSSGDNGPAIAAWLDSPFGVALDSQGTLYIADTLNHRIRRVVP